MVSITSNYNTSKVESMDSIQLRTVSLLTNRNNLLKCQQVIEPFNAKLFLGDYLLC